MRDEVVPPGVELGSSSRNASNPPRSLRVLTSSGIRNLGSGSRKAKLQDGKLIGIIDLPQSPEQLRITVTLLSNKKLRVLVDEVGGDAYRTHTFQMEKR